MKDSIFSYEIHPLKQGAGFFAMLLAMYAMTFLVQMSGITEVNPMLYWEFLFMLILIYSLTNCIFFFAYKNENIYWLYSLIVYVLIAGGGGLIAYLVSGLPLNEAGSFRWLYVVFTIGYIVFLTIVRLMRVIIVWAKKKDSRLRGEG